MLILIQFVLLLFKMWKLYRKTHIHTKLPDPNLRENIYIFLNFVSYFCWLSNWCASTPSVYWWFDKFQESLAHTEKKMVHTTANY